MIECCIVYSPLQRKTLLYSTWVSQTLPLRFMNNRYCKTWEDTQGNLFLPYFIHITLNDSGEVSSGGMYSNKNRRIHTDRTPSPHTMSICVYLLKRLTICNDVYNSHPRCEGSTVNISSTSDSVFEVCYEFCARFFVCFGFFFLPNRRRFCTSPDKQRSKEYLCSYSLGFVLYLLS